MIRKKNSRLTHKERVQIETLLQEVRETDNWENWVLYMLDSVEQISKETITNSIVKIY